MPVTASVNGASSTHLHVAERIYYIKKKIIKKDQEEAQRDQIVA